MTNEEIDKLGQELNALIAENVMGWQYKPNKHNEFHWQVREGVWAAKCPAYSTEIGAAWKVVEKFHADYEFKLTYWESNGRTQTMDTRSL